MFGRLSTDCGYTPEQVRELTLDDVGRIFRHWARFPPVRDLVAAYIGFEVKPDEPEATKYMTADDFARLMAMTGGKIPGLD